MSRRWLSGVRARLTLSYVAAMLVVLAVYAGGVFGFVNRSASRALDTQVRADFMWAAEMWESRADGELIWFDADGVREDEDSPWLQVWTPDGKLAFQTAVAKRNPLLESATLARAASGAIERVDSGGLVFRVLSRPLLVGGRPVVIQLARSEAPMRRELYQLVLFLALGLPFGVGAAALGGYALARGALTPISRMAERARTITAERLSARLPVDNPHDELGLLAGVFNRTLERLEQSFEQMQRFTGDVSHELRTPLTAMRTVGEVALRESRNPDAYRATIGSMLEDADRLTSLIDRLLTLSRAGAADHVRPELLDLGGLAADVATHLGVLADEKRQTLDVRHAAPARCVADRMMLRQALINLVHNAIKYSPEAATIRIEARAGAGEVSVEVADCGPGIEPSVGPRIFDRFYRAAEHDEGRSHGLGLAIAKAAVEANRGTLTWESRPGGGSLFRFSVPRAGAAKTASTGSAPASVPADTHWPRIGVESGTGAVEG